jgi:hypothetical protein
LERTIYAACAVALLIGFLYDGLTRRPRDKVITRLIQPYIDGNSPKTLSLVATEYKSYQFYTFRRGCYWDELPLNQSPATLIATPKFSRVRAFVLEPDDLAKPAITPWLDWLQSHTTEKTAELNAELGAVSGLRVFVRLPEQFVREVP